MKRSSLVLFALLPLGIASSQAALTSRLSLYGRPSGGPGADGNSEIHDSSATDNRLLSYTYDTSSNYTPDNPTKRVITLTSQADHGSLKASIKTDATYGASPYADPNAFYDSGFVSASVGASFTESFTINHHSSIASRYKFHITGNIDSNIDQVDGGYYLSLFYRESAEDGWETFSDSLFISMADKGAVDRTIYSDAIEHGSNIEIKVDLDGYFDIQPHGELPSREIVNLDLGHTVVLEGINAVDTSTGAIINANTISGSSGKQYAIVPVPEASSTLCLAFSCIGLLFARRR